MISKQTRAQIKALLSSPQWGAVEEVANEVCAKIRDEMGKKETEWDTVSNTLLLDGEQRGVRRLLHELQRQIQNNEF